MEIVRGILAATAPIQTSAIHIVGRLVVRSVGRSARYELFLPFQPSSVFGFCADDESAWVANFNLIVSCMELASENEKASIPISSHNNNNNSSRNLHSYEEAGMDGRKM
jgi:hypothetical protein